MKNLLVIILLFSAVLSACEKSSYTQEKKSSNSGDFPTSTNPEDYPTTCLTLDTTLIKQKRTDYHNKNLYVSSSLNTFGFCDWNGDPKSRGIPPYKGDVTESEAKAIIKEFVSKNSSETGMSNLENFDFLRSEKDSGYQGSILWYFRSQNQKVDNIEILNSSILFVLTNKGLTTCLGNWYPEVCVPDSFNFDQSKAKSTLIGQEVTYGSWSGVGTSKTITENDLNECDFTTLIKPVEYSDKIELRVCWKIYASRINYIFYVDVMTGELISKGSTIFY
ncbi:MAG TPA: hypothetical protein VK155_19655 [Bacteroidales bacterium]|jgi:hypothetical protein|nr:hypothetical protein [Bacteroidales bacterium]